MIHYSRFTPIQDRIILTEVGRSPQNILMAFARAAFRLYQDSSVLYLVGREAATNKLIKKVSNRWYNSLSKKNALTPNVCFMVHSTSQIGVNRKVEKRDTIPSMPFTRAPGKLHREASQKLAEYLKYR